MKLITPGPSFSDDGPGSIALLYYFAITQTLPPRAEAYMHCIFELVDKVSFIFF